MFYYTHGMPTIYGAQPLISGNCYLPPVDSWGHIVYTPDNCIHQEAIHL